MKIALVNPPYFAVYKGFEEVARIGACYPPMGLLYLAGKLLDDGHDVRIFDVDIEDIKPDELANLIHDFEAGLVGITSTTPTILEARNIAQAIKLVHDAPVIIGGSHVTVVAEQLLEKYSVFDYAALGEAELTLSDFVKCLESGGDFAEVKGILYRKEGNIIRTLPRPLVEDLDELPFPARHLVKNELYKWAPPKQEVTPMTALLTKRGCPYKCTFCSQDQVFTRTVRYRSVENVLDELELIVNGLGLHHIHIFDDTLVLDRARAIKICEGIKERNLKFTWEGMARANLIDEELLRIQVDVGLTQLSLGVESGSPGILKSIQKNVTLDQIREAYRIGKKVGIETRAFAILGHPNETKKTAWETINFLRSVKEIDMLYLNIMVPYPGTAAWFMAKSGQAGYRLLSEDFENFVRYETPVIEVNDLTAKDLARLQKIGLWLFYLSPRRIMYNLLRTGLKNGIVNALTFLTSFIGNQAKIKMIKKAFRARPFVAVPQMSEGSD